MTIPPPYAFDAERDLVLDRVVDVPPNLVWKAWTTPTLLMPWFCPKPWSTVACEIDLRPGGAFRTTMRSPEGQEFPNVGCYLELIPDRRLVWTDVLGPGFRPIHDASDRPFVLTAALFLEPEGTGTRYTAFAMHADTKARDQHSEMGFEHGWSAVLDQLVAFIKTW